MPSVTCPTCKRQSEYSATNPWRPFCSERCKLIDLGEWASEKHAIPGEPLMPSAEESIDTEGDPRLE